MSGRGEDLAGRLGSLETRHSQVHQHNVGSLRAGALDCDSVGRGRDDLDVVDQAEQHRQSLADDRLVICDEDADAHAGTSISTRQPSGVARADIEPPACSIRSRSPSSPWPPPIPCRGGLPEAPLSTESFVQAGS